MWMESCCFFLFVFCFIDRTDRGVNRQQRPIEPDIHNAIAHRDYRSKIRGIVILSSRSLGAHDSYDKATVRANASLCRYLHTIGMTPLLAYKVFTPQHGH
jgi:hypothetical protein